MNLNVLTYRVVAAVLPRVAAMSLLLVAAAATRSRAEPTVVRVDEPLGEFRRFANGELVFGAGEGLTWEGIPDELNDRALLYWNLIPDQGWPRVSYGRTSFEVLRDGPVWLITTTRFGAGGNASGGWLPEVTFRNELEADGWREI